MLCNFCYVSTYDDDDDDEDDDDYDDDDDDDYHVLWRKPHGRSFKV